MVTAIVIGFGIYCVLVVTSMFLYRAIDQHIKKADERLRLLREEKLRLSNDLERDLYIGTQNKVEMLKRMTAREIGKTLLPPDQ